MSSRYIMRIIDTLTDRVVEFEPGLAIEVNFIDDCVNRIVDKGVSFRTNSTVSAHIRRGIEEAINDLKTYVKPGAIGG